MKGCQVMKNKGNKKMPKVIHNPMLTVPALILPLCYALNLCFILTKHNT